MAALFPPFYRSLAIHAGLAQNQATAYWGYTTSAALLIIALLAPVLGAIADYTGGKKHYVAVFAGLGMAATASFVFIAHDSWIMASLLFIAGNIGFAGANVFYESLLPHVAQRNDIDQVSTRGYALGYLGGGLLLVVNVLWIIYPKRFSFPDINTALNACFVSVAVWWGVFSVPFFRYVPEPPSAEAASLPGSNPIKEGFRRLGSTFKEIRRYRQLLLFLFAYWIYNDGIGTIIKMATAYGSEIGIGLTDMTLALVITQFVGIPFTFLFGGLAGKIGAKKAIIFTLTVYAIICVGGFFMRTALHFYILSFLVGTVQGGSQALSRSLYGSMVPEDKAAEFFGFFSTSGKFAGIAGPALFGLVSQFTGKSRLSILFLVAFFVVGGIILAFVEEKQGQLAVHGGDKISA